MDSFEELGLAPALVEALAAEGLETPTGLQTHAIPVLRRGHSAVLRTGPGAGLLAAYGIPLLDRLEPGRTAPGALVLTPTRREARALALSLSRPAGATGHRVGALGTPWALPGHSDILFATPSDLLAAIRGSEVKTDQVRTLVLEGASLLLEGAGAEEVTAALQSIGAGETQIVVVGDPLSEAVRDFVEGHMRRAVFLPPEAASRDDGASAPVQRGRLQVRTVEEDKEDVLLDTVSHRLEEGARHLLAFVRTEDRAADMGDLLGLHGFIGGPPGDTEVPVWLGVEALEAREALKAWDGNPASLTVISVDVPTDADELDRRHGMRDGEGIVLAHPRELPHLNRIAREAGYTLTPAPPGDRQEGGDVARFLERVEEALRTEDLAPYLLMLEPLIRKRGSAEVAAALASLLRRKVARDAGPSPMAGDAGAAPPAAWVRIFLSIGERDGVRAGDLLGAITGETGVSGDQVGRIELKDTFARVEVQESVAAQVIRSLNGTSIRGRSVRADYDRGEGRRKGAGGPAGPPRR